MWRERPNASAHSRKLLPCISMTSRDHCVLAWTRLSTLTVVAVHAGLDCARHPLTHKHPRVHHSYAGCSALHSVFPRFCHLSSKVWLFLVAVWKENSSRNQDVMTDTLSANKKTNQVECTSPEGCSRTRSLSKA